MHVKSLPERVRREMAAPLECQDPIAIVRASGSLGDSPGEGYVVGFAEEVFLFSRDMGESEFTTQHFSYADVTFSVRRDAFRSFLDISAGGETYEIKFPAYEEKNVKPLLDLAGGAITFKTPAPPKHEPPQEPVSEPAPPPVPPAAGDSAPMRPIEILTAALMYMATVDQDLDDLEEQYIRRVCANDKETYVNALAFYNDHPFDDLLGKVADIDSQQALCIMANVVDVSMADGVLHAAENELTQRLAVALKVSRNDFLALRDTLLIKNQVSILA
ncbi:MAG: TerB family tellurite resistance protein [Lentisphaerae bacterium]|jgi:hypothetical protein|nr:TerB family tellurite resistance protein [Lentisphaerota bacterium]MBT4814494.1 TerB family tellurite resistance protein [Lentisphaerota bacterium]MBT5605221.1 TerB family tellurite resistance protein [Lentisphaerota bacterium]MBT7054327.1 TerB family tellurite resistance protein [Lentisphaerota bacterium]MBT7844889.1 TerB family tellurite resistance protein [Lentisphaerota bacterium]